MGVCVLSLTASVQSSSHNRLTPMYATLLKWWCEDMDHEADPLCNLLFADRHLTQTADGTQLRGLDAMMAKHKPSTAREVSLKFGPIFSAFCESKRTKQGAYPRECKDLMEGNFSTVPGIFRGDEPVTFKPP